MNKAIIAAALTAFCVQQPTFRGGVDVVRVDVSVMRGRTPVAGLTAQDFALTDNGAPEKVTSVTLEQLPISVMLVLDTSGSVAGAELAHLVDAGQQLVRALRPDDRAALITFSQQVRVDVRLTRDAASVRRALAGLHGHGTTSLNDAIHVALTLQPLDTSRCLIVVFSDGADNYSWTRAAALADEVKHSTAVIHAIELRSDTPPPLTSAVLEPQLAVAGVPTLQAVTSQSGGRVWSATSPRDLRTLFTDALQEMRARYLLTYSPAGPPQPGWHTLKVSLTRVRAQVTARPGYLVATK
ncbi:MAG: VWA domain-containing protein [Vicinamibacterales bacterium]